MSPTDQQADVSRPPFVHSGAEFVARMFPEWAATNPCAVCGKAESEHAGDEKFCPVNATFQPMPSPASSEPAREAPGGSEKVLSQKVVADLRATVNDRWLTPTRAEVSNLCDSHERLRAQFREVERERDAWRKFWDHYSRCNDCQCLGTASCRQATRT